MAKLKQILIFIFMIESGLCCFSKKKSSSLSNIQTTPRTEIPRTTTTTRGEPTYALLSIQKKQKNNLESNNFYF